MWRSIRGRLRVAAIAAALTSHPAIAQLNDCRELGRALTEHSCFHALYGPWETVTATPGDVITIATPNVDAVHTQWLIRLPPGPAVVSYHPIRSGSWAIFVEPDGLRDVLNRGGTELPVSFATRETGCAFLPQGRVFELVAQTEYTLLFDGTAAPELVVVIEKIDDFSTANGFDADGDGHGDPERVVISSCLPPEGYVASDDDCDDEDPSVHPGAQDDCDGRDNDCDGIADNPRGDCGDGLGRCQIPGQLTCDGGSPACQLGPAPETPLEPVAESCNGEDDDCNGVIDDGPLCDPLSDAPICAELGTEVRCGCATDADCGSAESGRICDDLGRRCKDGCFAYPGRNGCPSGEQCDTRAPAAPGACRAIDVADSPPLVVLDDVPRGCDCGVTQLSEGARGALWIAAVALVSIALWRRRVARTLARV